MNASYRSEFNDVLHYLSELLDGNRTEVNSDIDGRPRALVCNDTVANFFRTLIKVICSDVIEGSERLTLICRKYRVLVKAGHERHCTERVSYVAYLTRISIRILRREELADLNYIGRTVSMVTDLISDEKANVQRFIDFHASCSSWRYNITDNDEVVVIEIEKLKIHYCMATEKFVCSKKGLVEKFDNTEHLNNWVLQDHEVSFSQYGFDFFQYFRKSMLLLSSLRGDRQAY